jgi:hypothetical protein
MEEQHPSGCLAAIRSTCRGLSRATRRPSHATYGPSDRAVTTELRQLDVMLQEVDLTDTPNKRLNPFIDQDNKFCTALIYKLLVLGSEPECDYASFIWRNKPPPRVQFFSWLLVQERIQYQANLLFKHIVDSDTCELCSSSSETSDYITF